MKYCPNCGKENEEGQKFCDQCGQEIAEEKLAMEPEREMEDTPTKNNVEKTDKEASVKSDEKNRKKNKMIFLIVLLVAAGAVGAAFLFLPKGDHDPAIADSQEGTRASESDSKGRNLDESTETQESVSSESTADTEEIEATYTVAEIVKEPFAEEADNFLASGLSWYKEIGDSKYSLINAKGEVIQTSFADDFVSDAHNNDYNNKNASFATWYKQDGYWGLIDQTGNILQEPFNLYSTILVEEVPAVATVPKDAEGVILITEEGKNLISLPEIERTTYFTETGFAWYQPVGHAWDSDPWGIIDISGNIIKEPFVYDIGPGYDYGNDYYLKKDNIYTFDNGESDDRGIVDISTGEIIREPFADELSGFNEFGVAWFNEYNEVYGLVNSKGEILLEPRVYGYGTFNENGITWFQDGDSNGKWGILDATGKIIEEPFAYDVEDFENTGHALFEDEDGRIGIVNEAGEIVRKPSDAQIEIISSDYYLEIDRDTNNSRVYDMEGNQISEDEIEKLNAKERKNVSWYQEDFLWGLRNDFRETIATPFASSVSIPSENSDEISTFVTLGAYPFKGKNGWGIVSKNGNILVKDISDEEIEFSECGVAWYHDKSSGLYGILNNLGNVIKEPFAERISDFNEHGVAWYYDDGLWGIVQAN